MLYWVGWVRSIGRKRVEGIEPSSLAWKAIALPLSYTRSGNRHDWGVQDSNLRRHSHQIYSLTPLTTRETLRPRFLAPAGDYLRDLTYWDRQTFTTRDLPLRHFFLLHEARSTQPPNQKPIPYELAEGLEPTTC